MNRLYNTGETEEELRAKYNPDGSALRRAQLRILEMLKFLDKICKENKIEYFIGDGTLLGAYRHGGFIPWDDDVDVYMSARSIRKLSRIINGQDYDFVVQSHDSDKGYVRHCCVLRDIRSEYVKDEYVHNQRKYRGLQIDLFTYGFSVIKIGKDLVHKLTWRNENMWLGKNKFLCSLNFGLCRYLVIPFFKFLSFFKGKKTVSQGYETCWWHVVLPYDSVFPLSETVFEGVNVSCPNKPEVFLEKLYGNYNDLCPEESRNHHSVDKIVYFD